MSESEQRRAFRPAAVAALGDGFVVVDELQPVAAFVDSRGARSEVVTWRHLRPATEWRWPPRSIHRDGSGLRVHDQPDGPTVRIDRNSTGLTVGTTSGTPDGPALTRSRFAVSGRDATTADGREVRYRSALHELTWEAAITLGTGSDAVALPLGPGSITSSAEASDGGVAACVRRARKRPWEFHASYDVIVVPAGETSAVTIRGGDIDITELCWPRRTVDPSAVRTEYLPFVLGECVAAERGGAEDLRFTVRELDRGPVIDIEFRRGDTHYVRTDEPLDELGRPCGLRAWSIFLEEDLLFGASRPDGDGVVRL